MTHMIRRLIYSYLTIVTLCAHAQETRQYPGELDYTFVELSSAQAKAQLDGVCPQGKDLIPFIVTVRNAGQQDIALSLEDIQALFDDRLVLDRARVEHILAKSLAWRATAMSLIGMSVPVIAGLAAGAFHTCSCVVLPMFWVAATVNPIAVAWGSIYWGAHVGGHNEKCRWLLDTHMWAEHIIKPGHGESGMIFIKKRSLKRARRIMESLGAWVAPQV